MKTSSQLIYFGLFVILLGFGDNTGKLIPSWVSFLTGGFALIYGAFLHYKMDNKILSISKDWNFDWKTLSSKVYIIIGILLMRMNRFVDYLDEHFEVDIFFSIIGGIFAIYGLKLHFIEKREKRESGNIE
tara:strand:- start:995 stop:1384 length:390 start_codon:yes stop_codon:yes gene_type:complete